MEKIRTREKSKVKNDLANLSCTSLRGVGERLAQLLAKLNIYTVQDLLFHLPIRYQDRTRITPMGTLRPGDFAVIEGEVILTNLNRKGKRPSLLCVLYDGTGRITLRFFHFNMQQRAALENRGTRIRCFGEVRWLSGSYEMIHPEYKIITKQNSAPVSEHLTPIYSTTEGVTQNQIRRLIEQALHLLEQNNLVDYLPTKILQSENLPKLSDAVLYLHQPPPDAPQALLEAGLHPAQQRLAFEELLAHQLSLRHLRALAQQQYAPALDQNSPIITKFIGQLPFQLTKAQQRVYSEISKDLAQTKPMLRLVQGDVGSGKTIIAALAILQAVTLGYQAALMAPTELLAEQHLNNFQRWLEPLNIKVVWLAGSLKGVARRETLMLIESGQAQVIIGTHALFQKEIKFADLALIIIDEQHRFGVHQRLELREKGVKNAWSPHQLVMTATPIPRTLAMAAYADLDCSVIDELPPGRTPVTTVVISNQRRHEVMARVLENCQKGYQVYWVCTLIEESEILQCQAAEETAQLLAQSLPGLNIELIHGRLKAAEKEAIMVAFKTGAINLLVATTVIEVGVDVPNASLMIIENAERLGLAQLHQLRGRVGRGQALSHCVLMYQPPLSPLARERLQVMRETNDGFVIAQKDLEIRGPGEVLGIRQTGLMQMRIADLLRDKSLLPNIQKIADKILIDHPAIVECLIERWIGKANRYGQV